jgi:hypothetical protein
VKVTLEGRWFVDNGTETSDKAPLAVLQVVNAGFEIQIDVCGHVLRFDSQELVDTIELFKRSK